MTYQRENQGSFTTWTPQQSAVQLPKQMLDRQLPDTYYAGQGTQAVLRLKEACEGLLLGWIAFKAGTNYHRMHPDGVDATVYGLHAMRRWWVWLFFTKVWLVWLGVVIWLTYIDHHDVRGESYVDLSGGLLDALQKFGYIGLPIAFVFGVAIPYCRNVDYSLFKRRLFYKIFRPLVVSLDRVPNAFLYLTIPFGLFFPSNLLYDSPPADNTNPYAPSSEAVEEVCSKINNARENATPDANGNISLNLSIDNELVDRANIGSDLKSWYNANC
jgi:hypothetical protein